MMLEKEEIHVLKLLNGKPMSALRAASRSIGVMNKMNVYLTLSVLEEQGYALIKTEGKLRWYEITQDGVDALRKEGEL